MSTVPTAPSTVGQADARAQVRAVIVARAAAVLRLDASDSDVQQRLPLAAESAMELIDGFLDLDGHGGRTPNGSAFTGDGPATPEAIMGACTQVVTELYRRKDAPFGVLGSWSDTDTPIRLSSDWLRGVRTQLEPWRNTFGIG